MRHHRPFRRLGVGFQILRLGLQVRGVELEIGRPVPAGILVAVDHRLAVGLHRLDELHVAVDKPRGLIVRRRPEDAGPVAQVLALLVGVDDPHDVVLRQGVVQEPDHDQRDQRDEGPFHISHDRLSIG